jgi:hypothetical protein
MAKVWPWKWWWIRALGAGATTRRCHGLAAKLPGQVGRRDPGPTCVLQAGATLGLGVARRAANNVTRTAENAVPCTADAYAGSEGERSFDLEPTSRCQGDSGLDQTPYGAPNRPSGPNQPQNFATLWLLLLKMAVGDFLHGRAAAALGAATSADAGAAARAAAGEG